MFIERSDLCSVCESSSRTVPSERAAQSAPRGEAEHIRFSSGLRCGPPNMTPFSAVVNGMHEAGRWVPVLHFNRRPQLRANLR